MRENKCEHEVEPRHLYIAVMGVTGAGKTTFAKFLSEKLGGQTFEELPVKENPFFEDYYGNPEDYFPVQIFFLDAKWRQTQGSKELKEIGVKEILAEKPVIQEPPIYEDALYAQARLEESPAQWQRYKEYYEGLVEGNSFPKPDLIVFLRLRLPVILERIRKRAAECPERVGELQESEAYWERLRWLHEEWVRENPLNLKIITLDMDKYDFSYYKDDGDALEAAFAELKQKSGGLIK